MKNSLLIYDEKHSDGTIYYSFFRFVEELVGAMQLRSNTPVHPQR